MKPKTVQKILGHANISMTMDLYVHVTEDEKEKEMQKFEQMYGSV
jgi:integrase